VSKKLRALMNFVAIKAPTVGVPLPGETAELFDALLRIVRSGQLLEIVANQLVQTFSQSVSLLAGAGDELFVHREGDIHIHIIRAHGLCGKGVGFELPESVPDPESESSPCKNERKDVVIP
jgi:hypothetical protein